MLVFAGGIGLIHIKRLPCLKTLHLRSKTMKIKELPRQVRDMTGRGDIIWWAKEFEGKKRDNGVDI